MPDPTDPRAVADDPSGIVQQMPEVAIETNDPPRIWLQEPVGLDYDRTWCAESMSDDDVEYIRADIARATEADLRAEVERLRAALAQLACRQNWDGYEWVGSGFTGRHIARAALYPETDGGQDDR